MEKRTPHYDLSAIQAEVVARGAVAFTYVAMGGGRAMGLGFADMLAVIAGLTRGDFRKSMTTHADRRVWQDVYRWFA